MFALTKVISHLKMRKSKFNFLFTFYLLDYITAGSQVNLKKSVEISAQNLNINQTIRFNLIGINCIQ